MLNIRILSPIAKVLPLQTPTACEPYFSGLKNEILSFQLAFCADDPADDRAFLRLEIDSPLKDHLRARRVKCVPVRLPTLPRGDENYLNHARPDRYPDILTDIPEHGIRAMTHQWESLWFDLNTESIAAGDYPVSLTLINEDSGAIMGCAKVTFHIIDAVLPKQTLIHTKWFYTDCLIDYYHVSAFSEDYWRITENYVRCAVQHGINCILTPTHTPPLDTRVGQYRPAVQLVDIAYADGEYHFSFDKLDRWVKMCARCGVEYYEIAHLFTQWGAKFAPQIVAQTPEGTKRIFGWDTPATGEAYAHFLSVYLPALMDELERLGIADRALFHISDEPEEDNLPDYLAAKRLVEPYIRGAKIMDALSRPSFYDSGAVAHPVPSTDHIEPFLERNIPDLWAYYCISQCRDVSNLFTAMSGARTRVLGAQLYKFRIAGFLQWGYNFYYSQYSDYPINPWLDTDCDGFTPAGDAYQVYPGADGQPVASMRLMLVQQALQDQRAMQLLEQMSDRETVLKLIDEGHGPIRFASYPTDDAYVLNLRERINREIEKRL